MFNDKKIKELKDTIDAKSIDMKKLSDRIGCLEKEVGKENIASIIFNNWMTIMEIPQKSLRERISSLESFISHLGYEQKTIQQKTIWTKKTIKKGGK